MNDTFETICTFIGIIFLIALLLLLSNFIILWLWNAIMVPMFGAPVFTFWKMYGMVVMIRLILPTSVKVKNS